MKHVDVKTFQNWARQFIEYERSKGKDIHSINFRASCIVRYHPSGLMSVKPDTFQGEAIVTGMEICE